MRHARSKSLGVTFEPLPPVDEAAPQPIKSDDPMALWFPHTDSPTPPPSQRPSRSSSLVDLDSVRRLAHSASVEATLHRSASGHSWLDRWGAKAKEISESETAWGVPHADDVDSDDSDDGEELLVVRPRQRRNIAISQPASARSSASTTSVNTPISPRSFTAPSIETDEDVASIMATHCKPSPLTRLLSLALPDLDDHDLTPRAEELPARSSSWLNLFQKA